MGNAVDLTNPYFAALKIYEPKFGRCFINSKTWLFVYPDPKDFAPLPPDTSLAARLGERASDYGNVFNAGNNDFVAKKPQGAKFSFGFVYKGERFGVWSSSGDGLYFIDSKLPANTGNAPVYALTTDDNRPNLIVAKRANVVFKSLTDLYCLGCIRYESAHLRERFNEVAALFGVR